MRSRILLFAATALFSNVAAGGESPEPRLMDAVLVYTVHKMTESVSVMCRKWHPPASAAVDAAVRALYEKHAAKIEDANRLLREKSWEAQLKSAEQSAMRERNYLDEQFQNAPPEQRRDWCERFPERIVALDGMLTESKL